MAGDIQIRERVIILPEANALEAASLPIEPRADRRLNISGMASLLYCGADDHGNLGDKTI